MADAVLSMGRVQETRAGTVFVKLFKCQILVSFFAPPKYTVETTAGTALLSARSTFEMVYMSDFCLGLRAPPALATTALLLAAVSQALARAVLFTALDMLDV